MYVMDVMLATNQSISYYSSMQTSQEASNKISLSWQYNNILLYNNILYDNNLGLSCGTWLDIILLVDLATDFQCINQTWLGCFMEQGQLPRRQLPK